VVTILDLGISNVRSVSNAFKRVGAKVSIATTPLEAEPAQILVLPGVGAFGHAMLRLRQQGFVEFLRAYALRDKRPLVGICLGMQLLADCSHEHGLHQGLGIIPGEVVRLDPISPEFLVPNTGWFPVSAAKESIVFPATLNGQSFYHVHSFHLQCAAPSDIAATIKFGELSVVTAIERANVFGLQFHPEKSQDAGLDLLYALTLHLRAQRASAKQ